MNRDSTSSAHPGRSGYDLVYVISAGRQCKIGRTRNIRARLRAYRTHCAQAPKLRFYQVVPAAHAASLERHVHEKLEESRTNGEWFRLSAAAARRAIEESRVELGLPDYFFDEVKRVILVREAPAA